MTGQTMSLHMNAKVRGFFRLRTFNEDGICTKDSGEFENLITDQGLDQMGRSPYIGSFGISYINPYCSVGTGNTTPTFADTQLTSFLAQYPTGTTGIEGAQHSSFTAGSPPYYSQIWTYTFPTGAAAGNLAEVGVGVYLSGYTQPALFSHALIVDGGGSPTTITVTSTEILIVTYELRVYLNTTDTAYSFLLNGTISESGVFRIASEATVPTFYHDMQTRGSNATFFSLCNGTLQPITGTPTAFTAAGTGATGTTLVAAATYIPGNYFVSWLATFSTAAPRGTINCFSLICPMGSWQFSVSPAIVLTTGFSIQVQFDISWARF